MLWWLWRWKIPFPGGSEAGNWWLPRGIIFTSMPARSRTYIKAWFISGCPTAWTLWPTPAMTTGLPARRMMWALPSPGLMKNGAWLWGSLRELSNGIYNENNPLSIFYNHIKMDKGSNFQNAAILIFCHKQHVHFCFYQSFWLLIFMRLHTNFICFLYVNKNNTIIPNSKRAFQFFWNQPIFIEGQITNFTISRNKQLVNMDL